MIFFHYFRKGCFKFIKNIHKNLVSNITILTCDQGVLSPEDVCPLISVINLKGRFASPILFKGVGRSTRKELGELDETIKVDSNLASAFGLLCRKTAPAATRLFLLSYAYIYSYHKYRNRQWRLPLQTPAAILVLVEYYNVYLYIINK